MHHQQRADMDDPDSVPVISPHELTVFNEWSTPDKVGHPHFN